MSKYELAALDMDGTLLNSQKNITLSTIETIKKALKLNKYIVLSTGRALDELRDYHQQLADIPFTPLLQGDLYFSTNPSCCQELFSSFSPTFQPVSCDSFDIIAFLSSIVKGFSQTFFFFLRQSGTLSFPTALSKLSQLLSSKLAPHCRQVTLIFPFPLGTRSFTPQDGHLKTLYCRFCSIFARQFRPMRNPRVIARNFWFSCCLRPKFWENARTQQKAAAKRQAQ